MRWIRYSARRSSSSWFILRASSPGDLTRLELVGNCPLGLALARGSLNASAIGSASGPVIACSSPAPSRRYRSTIFCSSRCRSSIAFRFFSRSRLSGFAQSDAPRSISSDMSISHGPEHRRVRGHLLLQLGDVAHLFENRLLQIVLRILGLLCVLGTLRLGQPLDRSGGLVHLHAEVAVLLGQLANDRLGGLHFGRGELLLRCKLRQLVHPVLLGLSQGSRSVRADLSSRS